VPRRFVTPRILRLAVERALHEPSIRARARELARWAATHDAGASAAGLIETFVESPRPRRESAARRERLTL
jgi:UDP:flavonoid glycosyltransferase YjiC (YdhE family)